MVATVKEQKYYAEVYAILMYLGKEYIKRVPDSLMSVIDRTRDKESTFEIDKDKPLFEQKVCQETKDFIAALNLLYWENNTAQKAKLLQYYKKNDIIYEEELKEKYSYENLFKNTKTITKPEIVEPEQEIIEENKQLMEAKENFIQKIINKVKDIFRRFLR